MGKIVTPPYRVEYYDQAGKHILLWEERTRRPYFGLGKPTNEKAEAWRKSMNESFQPGGTNKHIRLAGDVIPHINRVAVVRQTGVSAGRVVAEARMPMFEVV